MEIGITEIVAVLTAALALASAITALTETPKDDAIVAKILKFVKIFSAVEHKDKIADPAEPTVRLPVIQSGANIIGQLIKRRK